MPRFLAVIFFSVLFYVVRLSTSCVRSKHFSTHTDLSGFRSRYRVVCFFFFFFLRLDLYHNFRFFQVFFNVKFTSIFADFICVSLSFCLSSLLCLSCGDMHHEPRQNKSEKESHTFIRIFSIINGLRNACQTIVLTNQNLLFSWTFNFFCIFLLVRSLSTSHLPIYLCKVMWNLCNGNEMYSDLESKNQQQQQQYWMEFIPFIQLAMEIVFWNFLAQQKRDHVFLLHYSIQHCWTMMPSSKKTEKKTQMIFSWCRINWSIHTMYQNVLVHFLCCWWKYS